MIKLKHLIKCIYSFFLKKIWIIIDINIKIQK